MSLLLRLRNIAIMAKGAALMVVDDLIHRHRNPK